MLTTTRTTYETDYKYSKTLPPLKVGHFPSFLSIKDEQLTSRCFPHYALHISPHRKLAFERSRLGFGPTGGPYELPKKTTKDVASDSENVIQNSIESEGSYNEYDKEIEEPITFASVFYKTANQSFGEYEKPLEVIKADMEIIGRNEDRNLYHSLFKRIGTWKTEVVPKTWEIRQQRTFVEQRRTKSPKKSLSPRQPCSLLKQRRLLQRPQLTKEHTSSTSQTSKQQESKLPQISEAPICQSSLQNQSLTKRQLEGTDFRGGAYNKTYKDRLSNLVATIPGYPCKTIV